MNAKRSLLPLFAALSLTSAVAQAEPTSDAPVVVELFTSQSCSSCPPADKLLGKLAQNPNVIAFSCHVTYWDHLNWRDTLSRKFCTDRQRAYAAFMNSRQIYTPQMVVNGEHGFVGSDRRTAQHHVSSKNVAAISLTQKDGVLVAEMPDLGKGAAAQTLWLIRYHDTHTQDIPSGENRGRTITYTNSIEILDQVDTWDGTPGELRFELPDGEAKNPGFALLAQPQGFGPITAAGRL